MRRSNLPPIEPTEEPFPGRERRQVRSERGPSPFGYSNDSIARMGLCAAGAHLAIRDVDVRFDTSERGGDFDPGTVEEREQTAKRWPRMFHDPPHVGQGELHEPRLRWRWCVDVAHWIRGEDSDLAQIRAEAADGSQVLPLRGGAHSTPWRVWLPA